MRRLLSGVVFLLLLVVCAGVGFGAAALYFGGLPPDVLEWVGAYVPAPLTGTLAAQGGNDPAQAEPAAPAMAPAVSAEAAIKRRVIDGVLALEEGIQISVTLPPGDDDAVSEYLLGAVKSAVDTLRRDYPEVFWLSLGSYIVEWSGQAETGEGFLTAGINYRDTPEGVIATRAEIEAVIAEAMAAAPADRAAAAVYFHDWIINRTRYASELAGDAGTMRGSEYGFNIDGVFLMGEAVCEGYTKAYKLLCDRAGIECVSVYGVARDENHSWNYIKLDGAWYLVDVTWDDPVASRPVLLTSYLLRGALDEIDGKRVRDIYKPDDNAVYPEPAEYGYVLTR